MTINLTNPMTEGKKVIAIQRALKAKKYAITVDGVYGPKTAQKLWLYKKSIKAPSKELYIKGPKGGWGKQYNCSDQIYRILVDGQAPPKTWSLRPAAVTPAKPKPAPKPAKPEVWATMVPSTPYIKNKDVKKVQEALKKLGYPISIDGEYGPETWGYVEQWKMYIAGFPDAMVNAFVGKTAFNILVNGMRPKAWAKWQQVAADRRKDRNSIAHKRERATDIMLQWAKLGYKEKPMGSNRVPQLIELARSEGVPTWISNMGYAWCAFGTGLGGVCADIEAAKLGMIQYKYQALLVSAIANECKARRNGLAWIGGPNTSGVKKGDLVFIKVKRANGTYDNYGHIERVVATPANGKVKTVGCNTSAFASGSVDNGDGVYYKNEGRPLSTVTGFGRETK